MNHLYLQLGRAIAGQCPPGFRQARLEASPDEGAWRLTCTPREGADVEPAIGEEARGALAAPLAEIRDGMEAEDGKRWRSCTVTLIAGGGFQMDVGY